MRANNEKPKINNAIRNRDQSRKIQTIQSINQNYQQKNVKQKTSKQKVAGKIKQNTIKI